MTCAHPTSPRRLLYVANEDFAFLLNRLPMARAAREAGFEVHVANNVDKGAGVIEAEGFILHRIPFRRGGLSPFAAIPTVWALRKVKNEIKPEIVHHSGLQCCVYGSIAAIAQKIPLVNAITGLGYIFTSTTWRTRLLRHSIVLLLPWLLNIALEALPFRGAAVASRRSAHELAGSRRLRQADDRHRCARLPRSLH
jgi:hypothetical protein